MTAITFPDILLRENGWKCIRRGGVIGGRGVAARYPLLLSGLTIIDVTAYYLLLLSCTVIHGSASSDMCVAHVSVSYVSLS